MPQQDDEASEVNEAQEVGGLHLVSRADAPESQQPSEESLDLPAAAIASKGPTVLLAGALAGANGRDQLDSLPRERLAELRTVVGTVADEPRGLGFGEAGFERGIDESNFVTLTRSDGGRYRKTTAVCDRHDLGGSPATSSSHKKTPFFAPA